MNIDKTKLKRDYEVEPLGKLEKPLEDDLRYLFIELNMTVEDLSKYFRKGSSSVARWLKKYDIKKGTKHFVYATITEQELEVVDKSRLSRDFQETPWKPHVDTPVKSDFEYLYIELNWSSDMVATYLGLSPGRVRDILVKFELSKDKEAHYSAVVNSVQKKYGVRSISQLEEIKQKKEETMMKNYGVKSLLSDNNFKKQAMLNKYNKEHALQVPELKKKQEETLLKNCGKTFSEIAVERVREKYKVNNVFELKEVQEKSKKTRIKKYGTANNMMVPEIRDKVFSTNKGKYGEYGSPFKSESVREKARLTFLKKYGVEHPWKNTIIREKSINTLLNKMKAEGITAHPSYKHVKHKEDFNKEYWLNNFIDKRSGAFDVAECASYHGVRTNCICNMMRYFGITLRHKRTSVQEVTIREYIESLGFEVIQNTRKVIAPKEIDLYIPEASLAIEYDGLIYHSQGENKKFYMSPSAHLEKTVECLKRGIQLLHIFEPEWYDPIIRDIWMSMISAKLGCNDIIYARNTIVKKVPASVSKEFCNINHLQGAVSSSVNYGLYAKDTDELVSLMTFSKPRFNKNYDWELLRFCNKKYTSVVGGASKLLKAFRLENSGSVLSYANRRWSDGTLYIKLGFELLHDTNPAYSYYKVRENGISPESIELLNRVRFQKHKLKNKLENFNPEKTELENMYENGYRTIYDCGNLVYVLVG